MHVIHAADAVILQGCNILKTAKAEVLDLRIGCRARLLGRRALATANDTMRW